MSNGQILAWGDPENGGVAPPVPSGRHIISITSNRHAFAALLDDGSLLCWGNNFSGGATPSLPYDEQGKLIGVTALFSNERAFAALLENGQLLCWGDPAWGGTVPTDPSVRTSLRKEASSLVSPPKKIRTIFSNVTAFAALLEDGSLFCWGNRYGGGETPPLPAGKKVISVVATDFSFTALLEDQSLLCWGDFSCEEIATLLAQNSKKVIALAVNGSATNVFLRMRLSFGGKRREALNFLSTSPACQQKGLPSRKADHQYPKVHF